MTATTVASCSCIPDKVFCAWSGCKNKLNWTQHNLHILVTAPFCCYRKSPSGMCAKLRTVAATNNRVHMPWSLSAYASHYVQ